MQALELRYSEVLPFENFMALTGAFGISFSIPFARDDPTEVMSAAKVKKREGHGYEYPVRGSIVNLGSPVHGAGYLMPALAGYRQ